MFYATYGTNRKIIHYDFNKIYIKKTCFPCDNESYFMQMNIIKSRYMNHMMIIDYII